MSNNKWNKILEIILEKKTMSGKEYKTLKERIEILEKQLTVGGESKISKGESRLDKRINDILKYISIGSDWITIHDSPKDLSYSVDDDGIHISVEGAEVNKSNKHSKRGDFIINHGKAGDADFGDLFICDDPSDLKSSVAIGIIAVDADKHIGVQYIYSGLIRWHEWDNETEGLIFKLKPKTGE